MSPERHVRIETIAWLAAILPLVAANAAYLISAANELVPWCFPYVEGCTSVSRAARSGPANLVFRGIMLPHAIVTALFWWRAAAWLRGFAPGRVRARRAILGFGLFASAALVVYLTFLGTEGSVYQVLRRYGTTLSYSGTALAQFLLAGVLAREARLPAGLRRAMVGLCAVMLLVGLASTPIRFLVANGDAAMNALEWSYSVLMLAFFPLAGRACARHG